MIRQADTKRCFQVKDEEALNPYMGFVSFQHFNGEALYSDSIVRPENNMCETENFECYPIPDDVPQNGREEGYHPDSTVAYIRILWKEFEPEQGVYNYDFMQDILDKAKAHGQTVIFRLMAHSTRARDDVPEWLKALIPCPERPDGKRVKDSPTAPEFLQYFSAAVRKLGERFDDDPTLDAVDISLPGSWGEGHNLHLYPDEDLVKLVDTYIDVFKKTRLMGQVGRPELLNYANRTSLVGWRGDGFGNPDHMANIYPPRVEKVKDLWKTSPVSFESYWWLGEWQRKGWDIDEIIRCSLDWHLSTFNAKSAPIPWEWKDKIDEWVRRMGYHYALTSFAAPAEASAGDTLEMELCVENQGVAPIYRPIPLNVKLESENGAYTFDSGIDIRKWLPGAYTEKITVTLPQDIAPGKYTVKIGMHNDNIPVIYLRTDAEREEAYYTVGKIEVK